MRSADERPIDVNAARLAGMAALLGLGTTALFLLLASARGLELGVRLTTTVLVLGFLAALYAVRRRHARPGGDPRLADCAGVVVVLFGGGLAGGLICLVGQTFALPLVDPLLHRADLLLGIDVEAVVRGVASIPGLPALLVTAYNSSFPILFLSALIFAWTGRSRRAWELCFVFNICLLVTTISSALIPATGPFYYLHFPAALQQALPPGAGTFYLADLFALRDADRFIVDPSQLQGVAVFPSFHAMLGVMTAAAWRDFPRICIAMCAWQGLVILSAIPVGGHYASDLAAGAICWGLVQLLWNRVIDGPFAKSTADETAPAFA